MQILPYLSSVWNQYGIIFGIYILIMIGFILFMITFIHRVLKNDKHH